MKLKNFFTTTILGDGIAILAGILMTLAFAPFNILPCAFISPLILFSTWHLVTAKRAFWRGWLFGLGMFGTGIYWVYISIHVYGNTSAILAGFFTFAFVAVLGIFPAVAGLLTNLFSRANRLTLLYFFPAIWVGLEWIRSWIFTGFPWLILGYSQTYSPLSGYAPLIGVYGISLMVLFSSSLFLQIIFHLQQKKFRQTTYYLLILSIIWSLGAYFHTKSWVKTVGSPLTVSLVQGNIAQEIKWSAENLQTTLNTYQKLTEPYWKSKIIVWPESAIPISLQSAQDFIDAMDTTAKQHHASFITGIPVQLPGTQNYYNAVIMLGNGKGYYLKHRLVPFGEYVPFHPWLNKFLDFFHLPMSDFVPATGPLTSLTTSNQLKIAVFICYEIAFPELVLSRDPQINMLLTVSNDAWFGHSIAQAQHLQMAQMRALELQRPVLFVSNNGLTAIIDYHGHITALAPPYRAYVLTSTVQPTEGLTWWQKFGMDPILFALLLLIFLTIREERKWRNR